MKWTQILAGAVLLVLVLTSCGASGTTPQELATADQLLRAVNVARGAGATCGEDWYAPTTALKLNPLLVRAAQAHSVDMEKMKKLSHTGSDGSDPGERIARTGYQAATWGENAAAGYPTVESVVAGWLSSPGHCRNMMNPNFTELGGGRAGNYWTLVFARPR